MNVYPIGNNLIIKWTLRYSDGTVFPLSLYDYDLSYRTSRGVKVATDTTVEDNVLRWMLKADDQVVSGPYSLALKISFAGNKAVDLQYNNAFALTSLSHGNGANVEVCIESNCDMIDLKDAVLQARKAMDVSLAAKDIAGSAVNTAGGAAATANEAKTIASTADNTSIEAKTIANNAKTVAEKAATDASRDAFAAKQAAQTASDHITSLQQAIAELPDGQAVSDKVAEHTIKLTELESYLGDASSYKTNFVGNFTKQKLSIPILKGNIIYGVKDGTESVIIWNGETDTQLRVEKSELPLVAPFDVYYVQSGNGDNYLLVHGKVYNNEKAIESQSERIQKNSEEIKHIVGFQSSIPTTGSISELSVPIHKGAIIYDFTSPFEYVNLYTSASGTATKVKREMLPYKVTETMTHANQYSSPASTLFISVYGVTEIMQREIDNIDERTHILEQEVLDNLQEMLSVNGIWAVTEGPNIGRFTTMSAQITKYCPIKRGDIISVNTNGITTRIAFSQEIPSEGVAVYDGPKTYEGVDEFHVISHIDGYFDLFYYNESVGTPDVYVRQNLRKQVYDNYKFPNKEIPYSTYVRADETETIADVILTYKKSVFKLIKGEVSPCIAFVDFRNDKFGFYTPNKETETVYQQEDFGTAFIQGHKYQISLAKVKGYIAKLSVTDLNVGTKKELVIDSDSDNLGISYCWGVDTYEVVSGSVQVTKLKLVSLQKIRPSLMILGDSNADHGGLGSNKRIGYSRLIKDAHNGDVAIFAQGGASAFDFVNWLDHFILDICKPTYALLTTYNTVTSERYIIEMEYVADTLLRHQITPIIATIHPSGNAEANERHQAINQWIKESGYMYFDLAELLSLNNDSITMNPTLLNPDLVHFTTESNQMIADRFENDYGYIFDGSIIR